MNLNGLFFPGVRCAKSGLLWEKHIMSVGNRRPVFLNLLQIRFPVTAILSILHRVAGVLLVLILPFCLYLFDLSLSSADGYVQAISIVNQMPVKLLSIVFIWSLAHHLFAGIRFLFLDLDIGISKQTAQVSAIVSAVAAIAVTLVFAWSLR